VSDDIKTLTADFVLSGTTHIHSFTADFALSSPGQTASFTADAKLKLIKSFTADALITDTRGTSRGTFTTVERDALPALQAQDTVLNIDADTTDQGNVTRAQYWTGSAWLSGESMQSPVSGTTNLFVAPTTAGWRVELGDPSVPIRYWDGTNAKFQVDNAGQVSAYSIDVSMYSSGDPGVLIYGTGIPLQVYNTLGGTEQMRIATGGGVEFADKSVKIYSSLPHGSQIPKMQLDGVKLTWGPGSASDYDVYLARINANVLQLGQTSGVTPMSVDIVARTAPGTPSSGYGRVYFKTSDKALHVIDDTGADIALGPTGSTTTMSTDTLWDALGDTAYGSGADTGAKLAGNTTTTKKYFSQTGNGTISAAPAWAQVAYADVSGTPTITTLANDTLWAATGDVVYATGNDAAAVLTANSSATKKYLQSYSSGAPAWAQIAYSEVSGTPTITTLANDTLWAAAGDLVYGTANDAAAILSANSTGTNKYLRSVSSGAPSWQQPAYTDISGTPTFINQAKWDIT
jgi:hypothetical protein